MQCPIYSGKVQDVLTEENDGIDRHTEVHRREDNEKVHQVVVGHPEGVSHNCEAFLSGERLEQPHQQYDWVDTEPKSQVALRVKHRHNGIRKVGHNLPICFQWRIAIAVHLHHDSSQLAIDIPDEDVEHSKADGNHSCHDDRQPVDTIPETKVVLRQRVIPDLVGTLNHSCHLQQLTLCKVEAAGNPEDAGGCNQGQHTGFSHLQPGPRGANEDQLENVSTSGEPEVGCRQVVETIMCIVRYEGDLDSLCLLIQPRMWAHLRVAPLAKACPVLRSGREATILHVDHVLNQS
mmetsp:Transcript_7414/g.17620  ORF Transcript_7414/g.17620 Transcript_7414/m.17620 type:complete len:291 (-) Transcript_7414:835-1707(-)